MNKEQQIGEMAMIIRQELEDYWESERVIANAIYNVGYRKVGKNDLLITEKDLRNKCYIMKGTCKGEFNLLDIVRKQTAKEILTELGEYVIDEIFQLKDTEFFKGIAKQYGVEIEK